MKFSELPIDVQNALSEDKQKLHEKRVNDAYNIRLYSKDGSRYIFAKREQSAFSNDKGVYMPFGGGSVWRIQYGAVQFRSYRNPLNGIEYELCNGKTFGQSKNGTVIPKTLSSKKEVCDLIKAIGIFDF